MRKDENGEEMRDLLLMENKHRWPSPLRRTPDALTVRGMASHYGFTE